MSSILFTKEMICLLHKCLAEADLFANIYDSEYLGPGKGSAHYQKLKAQLFELMNPK
jgi:hypothetical protein